MWYLLRRDVGHSLSTPLDALRTALSRPTIHSRIGALHHPMGARSTLAPAVIVHDSGAEEDPDRRAARTDNLAARAFTLAPSTVSACSMSARARSAIDSAERSFSVVPTSLSILFNSCSDMPPHPIVHGRHRCSERLPRQFTVRTRRHPNQWTYRPRIGAIGSRKSLLFRCRLAAGCVFQVHSQIFRT